MEMGKGNPLLPHPPPPQTSRESYTQAKRVYFYQILQQTSW